MEAAAHVAETFLAKAVVTGSFLFIRQHSVGFVDLFELFLSTIFLVYVRMILTRKFTECSLDLIIVRVSSNAQGLVIITAHNNQTSKVDRHRSKNF